MSVPPTWGEPLIAGPDVITGGASARAPEGASAATHAAAATAAQTRRTAGRGPSMAPILSAAVGRINTGAWLNG